MSKGRDALAIALVSVACMAMFVLSLDVVYWVPLLVIGLAFDIQGIAGEEEVRKRGAAFIVGITCTAVLAVSLLGLLGGWVGTRALMEITMVSAAAYLVIELGLRPLLCAKLPLGASR